MKLYEISNQYQEFMDMVESGEIPDEAIADTLASLDGEFEEKADNVACVIKSLLSEAQAIKAESDALLERADIKKHKAERLNDYLYQQFKLAGKSKIETSRNVLQIKKTPASVKIEDTESFIKWAQENNDDLLNYGKPAPKKKEIKQAIESGTEIPGVKLESGEKLAIK